MQSRKVAILQSNYMPWKGYFDLINYVDDFVIYDCVQYTKRDWRNRNKIMTKNGSVWLTVPVIVEHRSQLISETMVADDKWVKKHVQSIKLTYSKAQYFSQFRESFFDCYEEICHIKELSKINRLLTDWFIQRLGIETRIHDSYDFQLHEEKTKKLLGICQQLGATTYVSGPAAKAYLNEALFNKNGIEVEWMNYGPYPEYTQLADTFSHNVSAIDTLFCAGAKPEYFFSAN